MTELNAPYFSKPMHLLNLEKDIKLDRKNEFWSFGGTLCIPNASDKIGKDLINDHAKHGVEYIIRVDMSY